MSKASKEKAKDMLRQGAERWLARNRSLVLRQTPVWAQSMAGIVVGLGLIAVGQVYCSE